MMDVQCHPARLRGQLGSLAGTAEPPLSQTHAFRLHSRPEPWGLLPSTSSCASAKHIGGDSYGS